MKQGYELHESIPLKSTSPLTPVVTSKHDQSIVYPVNPNMIKLDMSNSEPRDIDREIFMLNQNCQKLSKVIAEQAHKKNHILILRKWLRDHKNMNGGENTTEINLLFQEKSKIEVFMEKTKVEIVKEHQQALECEEHKKSLEIIYREKRNEYKKRQRVAAEVREEAKKSKIARVMLEKEIEMLKNESFSSHVVVQDLLIGLTDGTNGPNEDANNAVGADPEEDVNTANQMIEAYFQRFEAELNHLIEVRLALAKDDLQAKIDIISSHNSQKLEMSKKLHAELTEKKVTIKELTEFRHDRAESVTLMNARLKESIRKAKLREEELRRKLERRRQMEEELSKLCLDVEVQVTSLQKSELKVIVLQKLIGWYGVMMGAFPESEVVYKDIIISLSDRVDKYGKLLDAPNSSDYKITRVPSTVSIDELDVVYDSPKTYVPESYGGQRDRLPFGPTVSQPYRSDYPEPSNNFAATESKATNGSDYSIFSE